MGIIDATTVTHTRAVGEMRDEELRRRVLAESDALFERYDCRQNHTTFGAFGPDLESLDMTPEVLLVELVSGSQYLIDTEPRVLSRIVNFQNQHFAWPDCPVAGTPEVEGCGHPLPWSPGPGASEALPDVHADGEGSPPRP